MTERILQGPFLTRAQAARRAGVPAGVVAYRPDLLAVGGQWLQEVYFAFQFDENGVQPDIGAVAQSLKGVYTDEVIGDWLVRPNHQLHGASPLKVLKRSGDVAEVLAAAALEGPIPDETGPIEPPQPVPDPLSVPNAAAQTRRRIRLSRPRRPAYHGR